MVFSHHSIPILRAFTILLWNIPALATGFYVSRRKIMLLKEKEKKKKVEIIVIIKVVR